MIWISSTRSVHPLGPTPPHHQQSDTEEDCASPKQLVRVDNLHSSVKQRTKRVEDEKTGKKVLAWIHCGGLNFNLISLTHAREPGVNVPDESGSAV